MKTVLKKSALWAVASMVRSCKNLTKTPLKKNQLYLLEILKQQADVPADDFLRGLPEPEKDLVFGELVKFAEANGIAEIDKKTVWRFFGGNEHIRKSAKEIKEDIADGAYAAELEDKMLVAHTLLPVTIAANKPELVGFYVNEGLHIKVFPLHSYLGEAELLVGHRVLVHFASIVDKVVTLELLQKLLKEQRENDLFKPAARKIKEIDYHNFFTPHACNM